ncbi:MAG: glycosyltransferase [Verrucomicrobiota bacterium]|nr:glycosyltransferase [Limisphaera sp.]MDW8381767.1 glycosyltransferase [Verrucomicrobiota bacterium]
MRVLYWIGDVLATTPHLVRRLKQLQPSAREGSLDLLLVSTRGNEKLAQELGIRQTRYFPFGYSPKVHSVSAASPPRSPYRWLITFVAAADPARARFIRELNGRLPFPVTLFGPNWHRFGLKAGPRVTLPASLQIHAASQISLNHMKAEVDGGMNMRFYEIPAAGGFQICSFQTEIATSPLWETPTYRNVEECARLILYYLENVHERETLRMRLSEVVRSECSYTRLFGEVLKELAVEPPGCQCTANH